MCMSSQKIKPYFPTASYNRCLGIKTECYEERYQFFLKNALLAGAVEYTSAEG